MRARDNGTMKWLVPVIGGVLLVVTLVLGIQAKADAVSISLFDGTTTVICADGAGCDENLGGGVVTYIGTIGIWSVNVTTALTFPTLGTPALPILDLNSVNKSTGPGSLTIKASQIGYTGSGVGGSASFEHTVGGTTVGTATFEAFLDSSNTIFAMTTSLGSLGPFGPIGYADTTVGMVLTGASDFSLTTMATITHTGSGATSFNDYVTGAPVPEPATLLLLGSGLVGMGWVGRKRIKRGPRA